jgi:hypothetical protein
MSSASNKRFHSDSGSSGDKRQRLSSDVATQGETKESDALLENSAGETKEEMAADRKRQGRAKIAESKTIPCIATLYKKIEGKWVKSNYIKGHFVQIGEPITFTSRVKASKCFGGMNRNTIAANIDNKGRSKIKGGEYEGLYVMLENKPVEPIMLRESRSNLLLQNQKE